MRNLNFIGPICSTGYGVTAENLAYELSKRYKTALFPIGPYQPAEGRRRELDALRLNALWYDSSAPSVRVFHQDQLAEHAGRGTRVGFPFFELDPLRPGEAHHMNQMDFVCVASEWARGVAERSGVDPGRLRVVPLGVDRSVFHENVRGDGFSAGETVFFTCGKWEVRKGHDFILRCFDRAFTPADRAVLMMMCDNPFIGPRNQEWRDRARTTRMGAHGRVVLVPRQPTQAAVASFMASGDVGLFPSRAEGWNLELLEAMSLGKSVVCTDYSGHTEFADASNALLVETGGLEQAHDGVFFNGEGSWAVLGPRQEEQMVVHMRACHRAKQSGAMAANAAGIATATRLSWAASAEKLAAVFDGGR